MLLRWIAIVILLCPLPSLYAKDKSTRITIKVTDQKGEPVDRAAVIVKRVKGRRVKASYELRTSLQGTAPLPPLQKGTYLVQVIAKGFQTHGGRYDVNDPEKTIEIKLSPPQEQFSVHK